MIREIGYVDTFVLLKFEKKMDREISHFNYNSRHCNKYKSVLKLIRLCLKFISFRSCIKTLSTLYNGENST